MFLSRKKCLNKKTSISMVKIDNTAQQENVNKFYKQYILIKYF